MATICELKEQLKARGIKGISGKNKAQLTAMLEGKPAPPKVPKAAKVPTAPKAPKAPTAPKATPKAKVLSREDACDMMRGIFDRHFDRSQWEYPVETAIKEKEIKFQYDRKLSSLFVEISKKFVNSVLSSDESFSMLKSLWREDPYEIGGGMEIEISPVGFAISKEKVVLPEGPVKHDTFMTFLNKAAKHVQSTFAAMARKIRDK